MKYKLFGLIFCAVFVFGFSSIAHGYIIDRGGGLYYNTVTGENTNTSDGSCGTAGKICSTTTDDFATQMKAAEDAKILEEIEASGGSADDMGPCTGEISTNKTMSEACAARAQAQLRARGHDATCTSKTAGSPSQPGGVSVTGLNYYYQASCTIDGSVGHGAELIVGFEAAPQCNSTQLARIMQSGSITSFVNEGCSNALVTHINPGWDTLAYELVKEKSCGLTATCAVPGATNINNPNNINLLKSLSSTPAVVNNVTPLAGSGSTSLAGTSLLNLNSLGCSLGGNCLITLECWLSNTCSATSATTGAVTPSTPITPTDGTFSACNLNGTCASYAGGQTLSRTRYVRIETSEVGWVSWKEIEIYDNAGNKLTPTKVDASVGRWQPAGEGADKLIDGTETPWNAGETVPSTNDCQGPTGCVGLSRSAFAQIDLGSIKNIGKIKLQQNGDTNTEVTKVFISASASGFTQVAEFKAPMRSGEWLEYPYPVQTGTPSIVLLVNGVSDSTINRGDPIVFSWDVQNANIATNSVSSVVIKASSPYDNFGSCPLDLVHGVSSSLGTEQAQIPLSSRDSDPSSPRLWLSNLSFLQIYYNCLMGKDYTITLKGKQRYSGREAQTSVVLRIKASAESPNQFGLRNENVIFTSNTYDIMYVGNPWNITISSLNPNETIYATGGKKVGGVVPTDRTPYVANNLGTFTKNDVFRDGDIGDWQLVWTRADGSNLRTLNFRVLSVPTTIPSVISSLTPSTGPVGASVTITGTGFSPTANIIKFGPFSFFDVPSSNNGTTLTFSIPSQVFSNCRPADTLCLQSSGTAMNTIPGGTYGVTVTNASGTSSAVTFVVAQNTEINSTPTTPTTSNLQLGSTGQNVRDLQKILGITVDGIFGPDTKAAVIEYQQKNGLVADGIVGPATRAKLATNPPVPSTTP